VTVLILVVDDEPDVEMLFRQQFRRDLRVGRFTMICPVGSRSPAVHNRCQDRVVDIDPVGHQHAGNDGTRTIAESQGGAT
jgi:hypothetical protein